MTTEHYPLPSPSNTHYTEEQRAAIARALKAAKPYLDQLAFICCSLNQARHDDVRGNAHLTAAQEVEDEQE